MESFAISEGSTAKRLDTKKDVDNIVGELIENKATLKSVKLSGCSISEEAARSISEILPSLENLESIDISDIFTGRLLDEIPGAIEALLNALLTLDKLETINLSDNAFGFNVVEPISKFLSNHIPLRHLYLQNNGFGPRAGTIIGRSLVTLAEKKKESANSKYAPLETIVCGRNRLEDGSMESWAAALASHPHLKEVRLVQNGIRPTGINTLIASGLMHCKELQIIDLQDNTFTHKGAQALARALPGWPNLKELLISDCLLSRKGSVAVSQSLKSLESSKLETLSLAYNELCSKSLEVLHSALDSALSGLNALELNGNLFSSSHELVDKISEFFSLRGRKGLDDLDEMESDEGDDEDDQSESDTDGEGHDSESDDTDEEKEERNESLNDEDREIEDLARTVDKQHLN